MKTNAGGSQPVASPFPPGGQAGFRVGNGEGKVIMTRTMLGLAVALAAACLFGAGAGAADGGDVRKLAEEVRDKGWLVYCARGGNGTWDLFASRPDGSAARNLTNTPDWEEAGPSFSNDGKKLLYRRLRKGAVIDHDLWGFQGQLMIANAGGGAAEPFGGEGEYAWASWSPDGNRLLCLTRREIQIVDIASKSVFHSMPRKGIYQQLFWSPDGKWLTGTGNFGGMQWSVVRMGAETGAVNAVSAFQSCTPDWHPDSRRVIFSSRPADQSPDNPYGWTQLYMADGEGQLVQLLYGEDGYHIYGGCVSPDGRYVAFTKSEADGGASERSGAPIHVMRMNDAPVVAGDSPFLEPKYPSAKPGPVLTLPAGWEPEWTHEEVFNRP